MPDTSLPPFDPVPSVLYRGPNVTHDTKGLPGFPAVDIMAPPGSLVVAPEEGTIYAVSGHNPSEGVSGGDIFGLSEYLVGKSGIKYYFTHLGATVDPSWHGDGYTSRSIHVRQGQPIGAVGDWPNDRPRSHLHFGVSGGNAIAIAETPSDDKARLQQFLKTHPGWATSSHGISVGSVPGPVKGVAKTIQGTVGAGAATVGAVNSISDAIKWIFDSKNILRVGEIIGGFILVLLGLYLLAKAQGMSPPMPIPMKGGSK